MTAFQTVSVLILVGNLALCNAAVGFLGCPQQLGAVNVDFDDYFSGPWYAHSKYANIGQALGTCTSFTFNAEEALIKVAVTSRSLGTTITLPATMKLADPNSTEAKFSFSYVPGAFEGQENEKTAVNYHILDTDYYTYSIIYNCWDIFVLHFIDATILTRDRSGPVAVIEFVYSILKARGIPTAPFVQVAQHNCEEA